MLDALANGLLPATLAQSLGWGDALALLLLLAAWGATGWITEHPPKGRPSITVLMSQVRREWMREFLLRDNRIFDAQIMASLRQGTSFFASTAILAVGGVLALIGNVTPLTGLAEEIGREETSALLWQIRLLPCALLLTHAFLKFVWANRVFGYCSVMMAAIPMDPADPRSAPRGERAAELNIRAAYNFNRGLRSMYFSLCSLVWLAGPLPLAVAVVVVTVTLLGREFASVPHDILAER
ncbi:DUF599 domain-containing protein [Rubellimicrobium aerolatum]|uniref:DUF599 domain-containing protein n=1 Tax=Rubellimicrobium aerolatum TaxID=490979 RepID=A0ABW0SAM4_9RHOB|nr:DUF599 domain-containing protein [Rubellimicrobium aerolatum]MBP1806082.1 putative membrane protein [Rubellimicrobium aerolatum]